MTNPLDAATLRRISVAASCDPRTVRKVALGQPVRGLAAERALAALKAAGLLPAPAQQPAGGAA